MNKYGAVVTDSKALRSIAFLVDVLVNPYLDDLTGLWVGRQMSLKPYAFTIEYDAAKQRSLAKHVDSSTVTLNVCLRFAGAGGDLLFYDESGRRVIYKAKQRVGTAILHMGDIAHRALPLTRGTRTNLILWCKPERRPRR